jgi:hypothetical protein
LEFEQSKLLVRRRSHGMCECCGAWGRPLDVHHRQARQSGGVSGEASEIANGVGNLLACCRSCHDETEHHETWELTERIGWRIPKYVTEPRAVPALLHTVNGFAWWQLTSDLGYRWIDCPPAASLHYSSEGFELRRGPSLSLAIEPHMGPSVISSSELPAIW